MITQDNIQGFIDDLVTSGNSANRKRAAKELMNVTNGAGTLHWKAPELLLAPALISRKSDIWAIGMVFFELVSLFVPFHDAQSDNQLILFITQSVGIGEANNIPMDCHPVFSQIMQDCWKNPPESRPSADELVARTTMLLRPN